MNMPGSTTKDLLVGIKPEARLLDFSKLLITAVGPLGQHSIARTCEETQVPNTYVARDVSGRSAICSATKLSQDDHIELEEFIIYKEEIASSKCTMQGD